MMNVTFKSRKRIVTVYDQWAYIEGERFEFHDLYDTVYELVKGLSGIRITNRRMVKTLKKMGIITSAGNRYSRASKGPCAEALLEKLEARNIKLIDTGKGGT